LGLATVAGIATALGVVNFFRYRSRSGAGMGPAYIQQLASCSVAMLAIINLRFDVWVASGYGISVAELHHRMPTWIVPALSAVLVLWSLLMLAITKPKSPGIALAPQL